MSLVVVRAAGVVTIQDLGRPGRMHEAVPPGGALVRELLAEANRRVLNREGAPAIEVLGNLVIRAETEILVAVDAGTRVLRAGDELAVQSEPRRVAYLAVRGGIEAPLVLGGRGAMLSAGLGARLRAGDHIASAGAPEVEPFDDEPFVDADRIHVIAGPDSDAFTARSLELLVSSSYRITAASDRVGTRLDGPVIPRATGLVEVSRPMVIGAVEVPGDGKPIVLGPEHPTTGGYPIVAVVACTDLGGFFATRVGGTVRFTLG